TLLAVAQGLEARGGHALGDQVLADRGGAALAEGQVVLARAALVAMAFDGDLVVGVLLQPGSLLVERLAAVLANRGLVGGEVHAVTDVLAEVGDGAGGHG